MRGASVAGQPQAAVWYARTRDGLATGGLDHEEGSHNDPMTGVLARFRDQERTTFADAWVGLEPTFQTAKSKRKWRAMSSTPEGETAYFKSAYMLKMQRKVARHRR